MNYWLVKSDPDTYGWPEFVKDGSTFWDGVRNYAARNHMKDMKKGDQVLFYHSQSDKAVVGIAEVIKEHYQDPTTDDDRWVAVDLKMVRPFENMVTLQQIKGNKSLEGFPLIRNSRLSVMPASKKHFDIIVKMEGEAD